MSEDDPGLVARGAALLLLLLSGAGLEMQAELFIARDGLAGLWAQAGFFTAWANLLAFIIAALTLLAPGEAGPKMRLTATAALLAIWAGYGDTWHGSGPWTRERATMALLHDATPLAMLMLWLARPHGRLNGRAVLIAVGFAASFLAVAMIRRFTTGWVPYDFLAFEGAAMSMAVATVLAVVGGFALLLTLVDRRWPQAATADART